MRATQKWRWLRQDEGGRFSRSFIGVVESGKPITSRRLAHIMVNEGLDETKLLIRAFLIKSFQGATRVPEEG
jgi:hypothetical protein